MKIPRFPTLDRILPKTLGGFISQDNLQVPPDAIERRGIMVERGPKSEKARDFLVGLQNIRRPYRGFDGGT